MNTDDLKILDVARSTGAGSWVESDDSGRRRYYPRHVNVQAEAGGKRFEFARFNGGQWEVYDHPRAWKGMPRFVGYLPDEVGRKFRVLVMNWWTLNRGFEVFYTHAGAVR